MFFHKVFHNGLGVFKQMFSFKIYKAVIEWFWCGKMDL